MPTISDSLFSLIILIYIDKNDQAEQNITYSWQRAIHVTKGRDFTGPVGIRKWINSFFHQVIVFHTFYVM